jgi:hypothetical protein
VSRKSAGFSVIITLSLAAFIIATLISEQTNTLFLNDRWHSSKLDLEKPAVGAVAFFTTRNALAGSKLNLDAWHAYNEVTSKESFEPLQLNLEFSLAESSDLTVQFARTEGGYKALRMSPLPEFGVSYIEVDHLGLITSQQKISVVNDFLEKNQIQIDFLSNGIEVFLNQKKISSIANLKNFTGQIGFRSQAGVTWVDDISLKLQNGKEFYESFSNQNFVYYFLFIMGVLVAMSLLFFFCFKLSQKTFFAYQLVYINIMVVSLMFIAVERYYFSKQYVRVGNKFDSWMLGLHKEQFLDTVENDDQVLQSVNEKLETRTKNSRLIALLGSSQTWGSGGRYKNKSVGDFFDIVVKEKFKNANTINLGVPGARLHMMIRNLSQILDKNVTEVILISGNNDSANYKFEADLERLWVLTQKNNIKLHIAKEANYFKAPNPHLLLNHQTLQNFADKHQLKIFDLHAYMAEKSKKGYLWWDIVHMTELGQKYMAEGLVSLLD